jgi:hypothetical protein
MTQNDKPVVVETLVLPIRREPEYPDGRYAYWVRLADIALARAREEQARIKEQIRPHVERYKKIKARQRKSKAA